ncbi:MAG: hypothetical protein ACREUT_09140 [Steroidobacteraceae bacterium]
MLATISASVSWWMLASDGSYLAAGSKDGLFVWSTSGQLLFSLSGDYSQAIGFAAPGEVRVAAGPAGQNVIQTVSVPAGTAVTGPTFNGQFSSWFLHGARFLTTAGSDDLVYSSSGAQQALVNVPAGATVGGQGNWVWTLATTGTLDVYAVSSPSAPAAAFTFGKQAPLVIPSGTTIGVSSQSATSVIDLSGAVPTKTDYTAPVDPTAGATTYAATSASQWLIGDGNGVVLDGSGLPGSPRYFAYGKALSIAGSTAQIAIASTSGSIFLFNAGTLASEGTIASPSFKVLLSSDGSTMAAGMLGSSDSVSLGIFSPPSTAPVYTWPYSTPATLADFSLSSSGTVLGQVVNTGFGWSLQAGAPTGASPTFSTSNASSCKGGPPPLRISSSGTNFATSTASNPQGLCAIGTDIYQGDTLAAAVSGFPVGWIDDGHLLVNGYSTYDPATGKGGTYIACTLYDPSGQSVGACMLPEVLQFQSVSPDSLYAINLNSVVSVSTDEVTWSSGNPELSGSAGTLAGSHVVFVSGARVIAQTY